MSGRDKGFFSSPKHPDRPWGSLIPGVSRALTFEVDDRDVKLPLTSI